MHIHTYTRPPPAKIHSLFLSLSMSHTHAHTYKYIHMKEITSYNEFQLGSVKLLAFVYDFQRLTEKCYQLIIGIITG